MLTAGEVRVAARHTLTADLSWPEGAKVAGFELSVARASKDPADAAVVVWRNPTVRFRRADRRRDRPRPLGPALTPETADRLALGKHPRGGTIGGGDFATVGEAKVPITLPHPRWDDLGPARRRRRAGQPVGRDGHRPLPDRRRRGRGGDRRRGRRHVDAPGRPGRSRTSPRGGPGVEEFARLRPGGLAPRAGPLRPRPDPRAVRQRVQQAGAEPLPHRDQVPPRRRVLRRARRRRRDPAPARPGVGRPPHGVRLPRREPQVRVREVRARPRRSSRSPSSTARRSTGCRPSPGRSCDT